MKRRDWLKIAATTTAANSGLLPPPSRGAAAAAQVDDPQAPGGAIRPAKIVDTHTHFYDPTRPQGVPWPPPGSTLLRTVLPADWLAVAEPLGIRQTIVVEASPWVEDNRWLLELAAEQPAILGIVGNLDPRAAGFERHLREFARNPLFLGIRWRQELVPLDRNLQQLTRGMQLLDELNLTLDVNVPNNAIPSVCQLASRVPQLPIVINHLGGAGDPGSPPSDWRHHIRQLAARPNVFMKVSALAEQAKKPIRRGRVGRTESSERDAPGREREAPGRESTAPTDTEYYRPILDHLWDSFGPQRLIYGSNWPVSDLAAPYRAIYQLVADYFAAHGQSACDRYFWDNAQAAYRWQPDR